MSELIIGTDIPVDHKKFFYWVTPKNLQGEVDGQLHIMRKPLATGKGVGVELLETIPYKPVPGRFYFHTKVKAGNNPPEKVQSEDEPGVLAVGECIRAFGRKKATA